MYEGTGLEIYRRAIRDQVCTRCIDRPPGGPPCGPRGRRCWIELHLRALVESVHRVRSGAVDRYVESFHDRVCTDRPNRFGDQGPCSLDFLLVLAVQAIEAVDRSRARRNEPAVTTS
jgi:hypothetical protein